MSSTRPTDRPSTLRHRPRLAALATSLVFMAMALALYSNGFDHAFHLDDGHALLDNPGIRSLQNIPQFFVDASHFSVLRANVDYRPVLLATFALNHHLGGYTPAGWHLVQVLLHMVCALGVLQLGLRVVAMRQLPAVEQRTARVMVFVTAVLFTVHPVAAGVVNYFSARSSLLTAALLLPAVVAFMSPSRDRRGPLVAATVLYGAALFTKVEAVAALGVFVLWEVWHTASVRRHAHGFFSDLWHTASIGTARRVWPALAVTVLYFGVRSVVMAPFPFDETRASSGVSQLDYLLTQTVVWWRYVLNWVYPAWLVADHASFPVYRSVLAPPVLLSVVGWAAVGVTVVRSWRRHPHRLFLAVSALALISPTSSVLPLSEMLNELRPYLPMAFLALLALLELGLVVVRAASKRAVAMRTVGGGALGVGLTVVVALSVQTYARTEVFRSEQAYLDDILRKAPSARALMNRGLLDMRAGANRPALERFQQALVLAPQWYTLHINLGIVHRALGDTAAADDHLMQAVTYDWHSGVARVWRGEHHLMLGRYAAARDDFNVAAEVSLDRYRVAKGLATAWAGLGDTDRSLAATRQCLALDDAQALRDIPDISKPFFANEATARAGLEYYAQLDRERPDTWWIVYNIGTLAGMVGDTQRMTASQRRGEQLRDTQAHMTND